MDTVVINLIKMEAICLHILSFARNFVSTIILYYSMRKLLPNRMNNYALIVISFVYALWHFLRDPALLGTPKHLWMNIFINMFNLFIILFLYQESFWRKFVVWWYFDIVKTMCEAVSYVPILLYRSQSALGSDWEKIISSVESDTVLAFIYISTFLTLFLVLSLLSLTIWRRILMQKFHPYYILFYALPMGIRYSLTGVFLPSMGDCFLGILIIFIPDLKVCYNILFLLGIFVSLISSMAILCYIVSYEKRAAIEVELWETKRIMELEQARYKQIEERSEELAKIRHDFNNLLASVRQLARAGDEDSAQELVAALSNEIEKQSL